MKHFSEEARELLSTQEMVVIKGGADPSLKPLCKPLCTSCVVCSTCIMSSAA